VDGIEFIYEQEHALSMLSILKEKNAVPNALLFTGIEGIGKKNVAVLFSMFCNCRKDFSILAPEKLCSCKTCRKIQANFHPDIIIIKPSGKFIKIDEIRKVCGILSLKPYEADHRFIIINDAHKMNIEAANAILKELEEPPEKTTFILTAPNTEEMLPTIISRCRHIRFSPISKTKITSFLIKAYGLDKNDASAITLLSDGSPYKAKMLMERQWAKRRNVILNELSNISHTASVLELLAFAEKINEDKKMLDIFWETIKSFIRDLALYKFSYDDIINKDFIEHIETISKKFSIKKLYDYFFAIESIQRKSSSFNINIRLALENILLEIHRSSN
jgi:DNA polymerase III subunit delta'